MKIFVSGSCRLLIAINGHKDVIPIHSIYHNFVGPNFLGKLHNTKQHIQFIKYITDDIILPDNILSKFLTSFSKLNGVDNKLLLPIKKESIKTQFNECLWYIFEICSMKLYNNNGFEVQHELTNNYQQILQTDEELLEDLCTIRELIPVNKKILFQVHFRPNIIYNNSNKTIERRDKIYNIVSGFCDKYDNSYIYDPSIILQADNSLFDGDTHFANRGNIESFNYIYNNYLLKY
jgi:hypothetical protein